MKRALVADAALAALAGAAGIAAVAILGSCVPAASGPKGYLASALPAFALALLGVAGGSISLSREAARALAAAILAAALALLIAGVPQASSIPLAFAGTAGLCFGLWAACAGLRRGLDRVFPRSGRAGAAMLAVALFGLPFIADSAGRFGPALLSGSPLLSLAQGVWRHGLLTTPALYHRIDLADRLASSFSPVEPWILAAFLVAAGAAALGAGALFGRKAPAPV
ncbi:MAG: hypothetical protein AAB215_05880 [Planctomycetota bacterium]